MATSISSALTLMVIGMITVFLVLLLVYFTGNILIRVINQWLPEPTSIVKSSGTEGIDTKKIAAISAAIELFSEGKARITKIEKIID
jgi:oxaloacetate decarboxylase gamma subunit